jgi:hypothetical protein
MASRLENGEFNDTTFSPQMVETTDELLSIISEQTNTLIDEMGIREYIDNETLIISTYETGHSGPCFCTCVSEDSYLIRMTKGNRNMVLEYNTENKTVEGITEHNFDDNGYRKTMGEWVESAMLEGLKNAQRQDLLKWKEKKSNGYRGRYGEWVTVNNSDIEL